ncbi:iron-sulfur cluster biosynthesis family protein [Gordoniibacillus kamchatkensis]|nr:iron-sulfur cluster biosynthesis family protein [Paenibacillus sp. VKM B-2647]
MTLTSSASEQLAKRLGGHPGTLRLVYDSEGCGCAVDGVAALWITGAPENGDVSVADGPPAGIWIDPRQLIFFEDNVKLDYREHARSFRLYSDNQIYSGSLSVIDRRPAPIV